MRELPLAFLALLLVLAVGSLLLWRLRLGGRWGSWLSQFRGAVPNPLVLTKVVALTALSWFTVAVGWWLTLRSVGISLTPAQTLAFLSITTVGVLLSFVPAGLGVAEIIGAALLERMGVPAVLAQVGVIAIRGFGLIAILLGAIHIPLARLATRPDAVEPTPADLSCSISQQGA
jgi:uncharacterized membrane protein YbhN (UPF0104 family)